MEFEVRDMRCGRCAVRVAKALKDVDASAYLVLDVSQKRVSVASVAAPEVLLHAISEAGYTPIFAA
ncbi:MAG: heavy-metal-associated domain-containing protein [Pararobbsia sp.]